MKDMTMSLTTTTTTSCDHPDHHPDIRSRLRYHFA